MVGVGGSSPLSPTSPIPGWWNENSEKNFPPIIGKLPYFRDVLNQGVEYVIVKVVNPFEVTL